MATLLRNGEIITASDRYVADIKIDGEKITQIGLGLVAAPGDTEVDCTGRWIIPGGIDVHTHLDMPFMGTTSSDDFYTERPASSTSPSPAATSRTRALTISGAKKPRTRPSSTTPSTWR